MTAPAPVSSGSAFARFRASLNVPDRRSLAGMLGFIVLLHVIGFGVMVGLVRKL